MIFKRPEELPMASYGSDAQSNHLSIRSRETTKFEVEDSSLENQHVPMEVSKSRGSTIRQASLRKSNLLKNHDDTTKRATRPQRRLNLEDAENDNYWSTSLYSQPPVLTSARCVAALREFFLSPSLLAVATESSSHPTGLQSVLSQPWLYAGGGLGNIEECPLQVCLAGAGTRRDSITFASVCVPFECHAQDLAADDFPASLELAAQPVLELVNNPEDDDDPFEYQTHPERTHHHNTNNDKDWFHTPPEEQKAWANEFITLNTRISKLNGFLQTGWTCGSYHVPFDPFPFGVPYLITCVVLISLSLRATCGRKKPQEEHEEESRVLIDTEPMFLRRPSRVSDSGKCLSGTASPTNPTQDSNSLASLSSDTCSETMPNLLPTSTALVATIESTARPSGHRQGSMATANGPQPTILRSPSTVLECWNASYHWQKLCNSRHEATACLDGFRVLSILWVVLGHVMAIESSTGGGYSNPIDFLPPNGMTTTSIGQLIFASRFAVDTFLVISGYLLVVVIARKAPVLLPNAAQSSSQKMVTFFRLIGLRLVRIFPLYLLCMGFFTQVAPHLYLVGAENEGGGPFWYQWDSLLQPCRDYGWTNLLFVNNFIPWEKSNTETCFYHSWYLAVDMQLFVLVGLPVTFFIYLHNPVWGKRTTVALWCTSVLLTAYLAYVRHWSINTFDGMQVGLFDVEGYAKPHVRGQAYFAGMFVAMRQLTKPRPDGTAASAGTWKHRVLLWGAILAIGLVTFCTVTGAYARRPCQYGEAPIISDCGSLWSPTTTFLYTASSRAIWSSSIGILMTLCLEGKGGWLNTFLSWPIWAPLAQLSFGTYLIHPIVIFVWLLGMREKNVYSLATFIMSLTSVCCVSFAWALVAALLVEFPVATLVANQIKKRSKNPGADTITNKPHSSPDLKRSTDLNYAESRESAELLSGAKTTGSGYGTTS